jgi:hypothetical protein
VLLDGVLPIGIIVVVAISTPLVSALELINLLVGAGQWMRSPFGSVFVVYSAVVASPSFSSISSDIASSLVMLLYIVGDGLDVFLVPYRPPVDAFGWNSSDSGIGLYASGGSKHSAVVGLSPTNSHAGILVLTEFGERSSEAANLVVEIRFG